MRKILGIASIGLACAGCPPNVQQQAGFRDAALSPQVIEGHVGDVVPFEVMPPVAKGTQWSLESRGLVRFAGDETGHLDWTADAAPVRMEAMIAPVVQRRHEEGTGWLWFGLAAMGTNERLDRKLPVRALPYREIAPVTYESAFSLAPSDGKLGIQRTADRVRITYHSPIELGVLHAPSTGAMLLETGGKKVLYAEVLTNFGSFAKDRVGYEVTFSYAASVGGPVEVVVVDWIGHGNYYGGFAVHRAVVDAAAESGSAPSAAAP